MYDGIAIAGAGVEKRGGVALDISREHFIGVAKNWKRYETFATHVPRGTRRRQAGFASQSRSPRSSLSGTRAGSRERVTESREPARSPRACRLLSQQGMRRASRLRAGARRASRQSIVTASPVNALEGARA